MVRHNVHAIICLCILSIASATQARPPRVELSDPDVELDVVGPIDGAAVPRKVLQDTIWIADWSFEGAMGCASTGWEEIDNRILNDGVHFWRVAADYNNVGLIAGKAAILGYQDNLCCDSEDGYDNDWYMGMRLTYAGSATLSFAYLLDSEIDYDFLRVETDSLCLSFSRVNYALAPNRTAATFRRTEFSDDGLTLSGSVSQDLRNYGSGTHCAYISFFSDFGFSPCDGDQPTSIGAALVVDDIQLTDLSGTRSEDFENGQLGIGTFANIQDSAPFGEWARTFQHISDNDVCSENTTCAWLWTDHTTPTLANDPSTAFGPGAYVIRNWLDNSIVSPWASLTSEPTALGTVLQFRLFPGNTFNQSRIVLTWNVRGRTVAGATSCVSPWGHLFPQMSLSRFAWETRTFDMSPFFDVGSTDVQVRLRVSDRQLIVPGAPSPLIPGPGPYLDRVRIGRRSLAGPVISEGIDARSQAQDCFATEVHPEISPAAGEHFRPSGDRFGTCALSNGQDLAIPSGTHLVTGDSVWAVVADVRGAGGIASVDWFGAVVSGPHAGKAPPPYVVGGNGFFAVPATNVPCQELGPCYFVDLDDTYFRGGDVLQYLWLAEDALGGVTSDPLGLTGTPASVSTAEAATGGLLEVSFLPTIDWDPGYLARIVADPHGDLEPTPAELANSTQRNCILYVQLVNLRRRSGDVNRTSFMYTLDRLGYRGHYDVYDHTGFGNTHNQLGGRATVEQAGGYSLIVYDTGSRTRGGSPGLLMPNGSNVNGLKIDQAGWFSAWLAQARFSEPGMATLWALGTNLLEDTPVASVFTDMGVAFNTPDQALSVNPDVDGVSAFAFDQGSGTAIVDFSTDLFTLDGGCPIRQTYDGVGTTGTAVTTHRYRALGVFGDGAVVMNANPSQNWNTVFQSNAWSDIRTPGAGPGSPEVSLMRKVLDNVLPVECREQPNPVDVGDQPGVDAPLATVLHPNAPNPFNPATTVFFDLAVQGAVKLRIYDTRGRLLRTLVDAEMAPGRNHRVVWDGLDRSGSPVASGIYLCRLDAAGVTSTRKLVAMK